MNRDLNKYKRATVGIPIINPSNFMIQLRRDNEQLIKHLEKLERGPFGKKK